MQTIIKKTNGGIILETAGDPQTVSKYATLKIVDSGEIIIQQTQGQSVSIFLDNLETVIEPAGAVAFIGTAADLIVFLNDNFFFDVTGGGALDTGNWIFVRTLAELPSPVVDSTYFAPNGVIYLPADKTYVIAPDSGILDLDGSRLETLGITTIIGGSSETSVITSTGLGNIPLLYSTFTLAMQFVSFADVDTAFVVTGVGVALDWTGVNFVNIPNVGIVYSSANFVFTKGAFINSVGLVFDGVFGTIAIDNSLFQGDGSASNIITITPASQVTRRIRIIYSSFIAAGVTTAIDVDVSAVIPADGYILDSVNFSGAGTYLGGIDHTDNRALFLNNKGIANSSAVSQYYMTGNAVATIGSGLISAGLATPVKVLGTTTSSSFTSKFTNTNNRATYIGAFERFVSITCTFTIEAGNNQQISVYIAKNGVYFVSSRIRTTTNGSGRAEGAMTQLLAAVNTGDFIEAYIGNDSTGGNMTIVDMNMVII